MFIVAPPSPFNKPRPAVVIQDSLFDVNETIIVALITSDLSRIPSYRIPIMPSATNGLRKPSEIAIDNLQTISLERIGGLVGSLDPETMRKVDRGLRLFLGLL